ncbi:MAG: DUF4416 family protein [Thermodesulfovibrionales bacterium]|nr:DUF4416 family protein [Thermodesulfovibrionales bacterium]
MGIPSYPQKALLFCSTLYSQESVFTEALKRLTSFCGEILFYSPPLIWNFSDYYNDELGDGILRRYVFFEELVEQDRRSEIKLSSNRIEQELSTDNKRNINLDPGYLTPAKIVLASTKDYSHRIYLRNGIFAEVTLIFKNGQFIAHVNTYPDYRDKRHQFYFYIARSYLLNYLRNQK